MIFKILGVTCIMYMYSYKTYKFAWIICTIKYTSLLTVDLNFSIVNHINGNLPVTEVVAPSVQKPGLPLLTPVACSSWPGSAVTAGESAATASSWTCAPVWPQSPSFRRGWPRGGSVWWSWRRCPSGWTWTGWTSCWRRPGTCCCPQMRRSWLNWHCYLLVSKQIITITYCC